MSSPPRSPNPRREASPSLPRKPSIVERTSTAIENAFMRRPSLGSSFSGPSNTSLGPTPEEVQYSMNPDDYEIGSIIGFGSSAIVHIATYKPLAKQVAIKVIDLDMFERNQIDELRREIQIMSLSKHENLLPVHGSFVNGSKLYIVTPFLAAGSCLDIIKTAYADGFEEAAIATILFQALQGLRYLHKNNLIHRDIKAGNLLVSDDGLVQLADFGVSNSLMEYGERGGMRKTFVGTPCWMAPEVMEQSGYDFKADIWSFGITAIELATGHAPFAKYPPMKVLMLTLQNDSPTLDREKTRHKYSKSLKEMIDLCLQKDPSKRPTAEKLLQHPFFKQAKKPSYLAQTIIQGLPPIASRPHNRRAKAAPKETASKPGESWDFGKSPESDDKQVHFADFDKKSDADLKQTEVKKGRFTVNEPDSPDDSTENSADSKKTRFAVAEQNASLTSITLQNPPTVNTSSASLPSNNIDLNASTSSLSRPSRFTVSKDATPTAPQPGPTNGNTLPRKSRFEISSSDLNDGEPLPSPSESLQRKPSKPGMEFVISPDATRKNSGKLPLKDDKIEELTKIVEAQGKLLNDIIVALSRHGIAIASTPVTSIVQQASATQDSIKKQLSEL